MPGGFLEKSESVTTTIPALVVILIRACGAVKSIFRVSERFVRLERAFPMAVNLCGIAHFSVTKRPWQASDIHKAAEGFDVGSASANARLRRAGVWHAVRLLSSVRRWIGTLPVRGAVLDAETGLH